jgi:hypothetical protein
MLVLMILTHKHITDAKDLESPACKTGNMSMVLVILFCPGMLLEKEGMVTNPAHSKR